MEDSEVYTITNSSSTTFTITNLGSSSSDYYVYYHDGTDQFDPLLQMQQDFEALANLFFQERFDRTFEDYRCPPAFDLQ